MNTEIYRFKVGTFECMAVSDGTHTYAPPTFPAPAAFLFANAPKGRLEQALREHNLQPEQWVEWISPYICVVVYTGEHRVLVDTGADGLDPNTGKLLQNLQAAGIAREDIDTVILTHGHPDHIGGNTDAEGVPAFPNARYVMWKDEWDFWTSEEAELKLDEHVKQILLRFARKNLPPIRDRLDLVDHEMKSCPVCAPSRRLATQRDSWRWPFPREASNCCASLMWFFILSIWSSQNGVRQSILFPSKSRPLGAGC